MVKMMPIRCSGSPPRAWIQCVHEDHSGADERFTSTRVETISLASEKSFKGNGSPPRAWRQCTHIGALRGISRFTSTRVETILHPRAARLPQPVHLHARGDNERLPTLNSTLIGSP